MRTLPASLVVVLVTVLLAIPTVGAAQDQPLSDYPTIDLGGRVWVTSGHSSSSIGGGGISRVSELTWRGLDAVVPEVNVDVLLGRLVVMGSFGGGVISDGVLIDDDFDDSGNRFSHTRSTMDESGLIYVNADVGGRVFTWRMDGASAPGYVDALVGFQYWFERYVGFGVIGDSTGIGRRTKAVTQEYNWRSIRLGARTQVPVYRGLNVKLRGFIVPWSSMVLEDTHHLRGDLKQDPSFRNEADGGFGVQVDAALSYTVTSRLSVDLGFQYWKIDSGEGDSFAFTTTGTIKQRLNEAITERYGPFVGVRWRF